jgi:ribosomal protein S28E/S33
MKKTLIVFAVSASIVAAQVVVPDGTKIRVRLDQAISSATADQGQSVELSVTEPVKVGDVIAIPEGARVTGTVTEAQEKRHMGRAGKLDFSIDRVRAVDGEWIPLRYTVNKKSGGSHAVSTGVLTAGAAVLFWPAAPAFLLIKGKDVTLNKGMIFDTFTDQDHAMNAAAQVPAAAGNKALLAAATPGTGAGAAPSGSASITITSDKPGADIEVDGAFVGSTPTTIPIASGTHQIAVRSSTSVWQRNLQVIAGSSVTLTAQLSQLQQVSGAPR